VKSTQADYGKLTFTYSADETFTWKQFYDILTYSFHNEKQQEVALDLEGVPVKEKDRTLLRVAGLPWKFNVLNPGELRVPIGNRARFSLLVPKADQRYSGPGDAAVRIVKAAGK